MLSTLLQEGDGWRCWSSLIALSKLIGTSTAAGDVAALRLAELLGFQDLSSPCLGVSQQFPSTPPISCSPPPDPHAGEPEHPTEPGPKQQQAPFTSSDIKPTFPCCWLTPLMGSEPVQSLGSSRGEALSHKCRRPLPNWSKRCLPPTPEITHSIFRLNL